MAREKALVTGSARGIGLAIVERLARDGFEVYGVDRNEELNASAMQALADEGLAVSARSFDICDREAVSRFFDSLDGIDVVVNNAGIFWAKPFMELVEDDFRNIFEVNVVALFIVAQEAAHRMKPGGRIINIGSRAAIGGPDYAHYVASKAAVTGLTRAMASDLADRRIAVNAVAPGMIDTHLTREVLSDDLRAKAMAAQPDGVMAQPPVIANAVSFFAAPGDTFVNGQILFVDGGRSVGVTTI